MQPENLAADSASITGLQICLVDLHVQLLSTRRKACKLVIMQRNLAADSASNTGLQICLLDLHVQLLSTREKHCKLGIMRLRCATIQHTVNLGLYSKGI
jgi:hypothetical protein